MKAGRTYAHLGEIQNISSCLKMSSGTKWVVLVGTALVAATGCGTHLARAPPTHHRILNDERGAGMSNEGAHSFFPIEHITTEPRHPPS